MTTGVARPGFRGARETMRRSGSPAPRRSIEHRQAGAARKAGGSSDDPSATNVDNPTVLVDYFRCPSPSEEPTMKFQMSVAAATLACLFSGAAIACEYSKPTDIMGSAPTNATRKPIQQAKSRAPAGMRKEASQPACAGAACTSEPKDAKPTVQAKSVVAITCAGGNCI
jgi:hypothetical protein